MFGFKKLAMNNFFRGIIAAWGAKNLAAAACLQFLYLY
jgi:hypothetical protein